MPKIHLDPIIAILAVLAGQAVTLTNDALATFPADGIPHRIGATGLAKAEDISIICLCSPARQR